MVLLKGIPMESADIVAGLSFGGITLLGGGVAGYWLCKLRTQWQDLKLENLWLNDRVEELEEAEAKPEPIVQDQPKGGLDKIVIKGQINSEKDLKALKNLMRDMKRKGWSSSGSWGDNQWRHPDDPFWNNGDEDQEPWQR